MPIRRFVGDDDKALAVQFKMKLAQRNEPPFERRFDPLIDANQLLPIGANDRHRSVGGPDAGRRVRQPYLI